MHRDKAASSVECTYHMHAERPTSTLLSSTMVVFLTFLFVAIETAIRNKCEEHLKMNIFSHSQMREDLQ